MIERLLCHTLLPIVGVFLSFGVVSDVRADSAQDTGSRSGADSGLIVSVESWFVAPRNTDLEFAFTGVGSLAGGGRVSRLTHDRTGVPGFHLAWRLASDPTMEVGARVREYDDTTAAATGELPQDVGPLLAAPAFLGFITVDSAAATSDLRMTVLDGWVRWRHSRDERGGPYVDAGARFFRYERRTQVTYREDFGQLRELFVNGSTDVQGWGPRGALGYARRFGRVEIDLQLGVALPVGDMESEARQEFVLDGALDAATEIVEPESGRAYLQIEGRTLVRLRIGSGWSATLAYAFENWADVERSLRFVDVAGRASAVPVENDAVLEGFSVGLTYAF